MSVDRIFNVKNKLFVKYTNSKDLTYGTEKMGALVLDTKALNLDNTQDHFKNIIGLKDYICVVYGNKLLMVSVGDDYYKWDFMIDPSINFNNCYSFENQNNIILHTDDYNIVIYNISLNDYTNRLLKFKSKILKIYNGDNYMILLYELGKYLLLNINNTNDEDLKDNDIIVHDIEIDKFVTNIHNHKNMIYVLTRQPEMKIYQIITTGKDKKFDKICIKHSIKMDLKMKNIFTCNDEFFIYMHETGIFKFAYEKYGNEQLFINKNPDDLKIKGIKDIALCYGFLFSIDNGVLTNTIL